MTAPTGDHGPLLIRAASAKRHAFSEKLLTLTTVEAEAVVATFSRAGVVLGLSLPLLSDKYLHTIKRLISAGEIGRVTSLRTRRSHDGILRRWLPQPFLDPAAAGGGALVDLGAHPVYVANWLMGEPIRVSARLTKFQADSPADDNSVAVIEYRHGGFAVAEAALVNGYAPPPSVEVFGTEGTIYWGSPQKRLLLHGRTGSVEVPFDVEFEDQLPSPIDQWLDQILNGKAGLITDADMIRLTQVMEAARKSQISGGMAVAVAD
jgi:predicted dehydrogenase